MALGSALAIGALTVGGSLLQNSATKKAANKAADTSLAVAEKNNQLARENRDMLTTRIDPFVGRGNIAGNAINELLGLQAYAPTAPSPAIPSSPTAPRTLQDYYARVSGTVPTPATTQPAATPTAATSATAPSAFDRYLNSTGYKFRVNEGMDALNSGFAGKGLLDSGASRRASLQFGQDIASDEFGRYLGALGTQQQVGLGGASALAGVGQNFVNSVSNNNNSAGTAAANAALIKGQSNANMWGGIANAFGGLFGSSYGG
jgi:hypothetical protein